MKFRTLLLPTLILTLGLVLAGCNPATTEPVVNETPVTEETTAEETTAEQVTAEETGDREFVDYTPELLAEVEGTKPFVLFFHADWCILCRIMEAGIRDEWKTFPDGTLIIKTNYDDEQDLRKKYEVASQSTVVMINADGSVNDRIVFPTNKQLIEAIEAIL
jgi:thiol-disulfide isomerase/thioredoxin